MDDSQQIYLTINISVVDANSGQDIATMALTSLKNNQKNNGSKNTAGDTDSDDEQEIGGKDMMQAYSHFHNVLKEKGGATETMMLADIEEDGEKKDDVGD